MALPVGTILDGKFKVVQILGEGGMGTVYKVEQLGSPYFYAVKELLISPNISEDERKSAIERFDKEVALLRGLKHPRIAALMFPFQERGNSYFVMEFVSGRSLEKILEQTQGPLPEDQVLKWMAQVCEALTYIHTRNPPIILRDLKPGNIMITENDEVQLIDFGIARRFDPNKRTNTENLGTISYASPEHLGSITMPGQRRSAQNPGKLVQTDARSDIYSLGATMYHLLTNYEPDPIQTPAPGSILAKNTRLRTIQSGSSRVCPVEQVIIKAMQQEPARRFQSAEAMRVALQQCMPHAAAPTTIQIPAMSPNATILVPTSLSATTAGNTSGLVCPKCGWQNRPGANFCKRDGQQLLPGAPVAPSSIRAQPIRATIPSYVPAQSRPVPQPIKARPVQSRTIQARPVSSPATAQSRTPGPIQARPVSNTQRTQAQPYVPAPAQPRLTSNSTVAATNSRVGNPLIANQANRNGLQFLRDKQYVAAINQFKEAQLVGGQSYDVLYNIGRAYRQYAQSLKATSPQLFDENIHLAISYFEDALRFKSDALDAQFQLGLCFRDIAAYGQAHDAFQEALSLNSQDPAIYYQLGLVAFDQKAYNEAEKYLLGGLRIYPNHTLILIALGRVYSETRQVKSAITTLRQATQIDPTEWEGWYELGRAHMKEREWKYALSALERARQASIPPDPVIYGAMGTCYLKMNRKFEARQMVNETLTRDPHNAEAIRLQKQL